MDDRFCINVDQLRDGSKEVIEESFSPKFLDIEEKDLTFEVPVEVNGEAFIAGTVLIVRLSGRTTALMRCAVCNEKVPYVLIVENFSHSEELSNIKGGIFNFKNIMREAILLELPHAVECHEGNCPERKNIEKYLT